MNRLSLWIIVSFFSLALMAADDHPNEQLTHDAELIKQFDDLRENLKDSLNPNPTCLNCMKFDEKKSCSMKELCTTLQPNVNKLSLYESPHGGNFPNLPLSHMMDDIRFCYSNIVSRQLSSKQTGIAYSSPQLAAAFEAQKKYYASIKKHHEANTLLAYEQASVSELTALAEGGVYYSAPVPQNDSERKKTVEDSVIKIEKKTGKKFSLETRKLYVDYLIKQQAPVDYNMQAPRETDDIRVWRPFASNPFVNVSLFYDIISNGGEDGLKKNQELYKSETGRANDLFINAKKELVDYLRSKITPSNRDSLENLIQRAETIELKVPPPTPDGLSKCPGVAASYDELGHDVFACPQDFAFPDQTLKNIFYHEIAHSFDPCFATKALFKDSSGGYHEFVPARKDNPEIVEPGIPYSKNPFSRVISCLKKKDSVGAWYGGQRASIKTLDLGIQKLQQAGSTPENSERLRLAIDKKAMLTNLTPENKECAGQAAGDKQNQIGEAFADWVAAEVSGQQSLLVNSDEKKVVAFESMGLWLDRSCPQGAERNDPKTKEVIENAHCFSSGQLGVTAQNDVLSWISTMSKDEHPWEVDRVDKIYLANPNLTRALNCQPSEGVKHCDLN